MDEFSIIFVSGITVGAIYALMALGYYLVSSATGIINFAQGELAMLAAVTAVVLTGFGVSYPTAILGGIVTSVAVSALAFYGIILTLDRRGANLDTMLVALLGLSVVIRYGTGVGLGRSDRPLSGPFGEMDLSIANVPIQVQQVTILAVTLGLFLLVSLFFNFTWTGRSYRVAAINPIGAQACGINLRRVQLLAFSSGAFVASIAGWLYAPLYAANYLIGGQLGLKGFVCLVIGGTSTLYGALIGGMIVGLLEVFSAFYIGSLYGDGASFIILIIFLMFRPGGVVGES